MPVNLRGRGFLTLMDFSGEEIRYLLDLSHNLKAKKRSGIKGTLLEGKNIVLLFDKTSTRTRCAFEVAAFDEGAHITFLDQAGSQMNKKESLEDTARVLGRFYDGIEYRGFEQSTVEALAKFSGVPVFNGLTDIDHPTQILADLMTMEEHLDKPLKKCKVVFVGDTRNNMSLAWMIAAAKLGFEYTGLGPRELFPDKGLIAERNGAAAALGGLVRFTDDPDDAGGADVVYTDVWVSMGDEDKLEKHVKLLTPFRLDRQLLNKLSGPGAVFMHCLPAFHDLETAFAKKAAALGFDVREVTDEVFRGPNSVVFDEAENRMHTIKAVLTALLG
ncbi:MAG: ornithine carbamoyltransferase [Clostridiales bacterium]|jgi:ornithine carbamoyltransferase|nr:ornithine carbamoyltransferase [Clostridiales bacterium]